MEADAFPGRSFSGEIKTIATRIDPDSRSLGIRAVVPNPDRLLKPGLFARVAVNVDVRPNAVTVPEEAIVPRGDRLLVYKVVDGKAVSTTVKVGLREYGRAEIVAGLAPGDVVITAGQQKVQDGSAVTVLAPERASKPEPPQIAAPRHAAPSGPVPASAADQPAKSAKMRPLDRCRRWFRIVSGSALPSCSPRAKRVDIPVPDTRSDC